MLYYGDWCSLIESNKKIEINVNVSADQVEQINKFSTQELSFFATHCAAQYLGSRPALCMSGGIDSQAAYQLWDKRFPIEVVIFKFANDLNSSEVNDAVKYVTAYDIDHRIITLDVERFLNFNLVNFAKANKLISPQFATHAFFLEQLKNLGYTGAVFGGNGFSIEQDKIYFNLSSAQLLDLEYYGTNNNFNVIPSFLSFERNLCMKLAVNTPINVNAYMLSKDKDILPEDKQIVLDRQAKYTNKITSYRNLRLPVIPQEDKKTGFEQLKDYYAAKYNDLWTFERHFRWPIEVNRVDKDVVTVLPEETKSKILYYSIENSSSESSKNLLRSRPGSLMSRQFL